MSGSRKTPFKNRQTVKAAKFLKGLVAAPGLEPGTDDEELKPCPLTDWILRLANKGCMLLRANRCAKPLNRVDRVKANGL